MAANKNEGEHATSDLGGGGRQGRHALVGSRVAGYDATPAWERSRSPGRKGSTSDIN